MAVISESGYHRFLFHSFAWKNEKDMSNVWLIVGNVTLMMVLAAVIAVMVKRHRASGTGRFEENIPVRLLEEERSSLKTENCEDLYERFRQIMEKDKPYLDPNLRVTSMAEKLFTNRSYLSQAIKFKSGMNFCQIVNQFRVREAMRVYAMDPKLSADQLAKRVGFNSQTTFNTAFRLNSGYTPSEWCREFRKKNRVGTGNEKKKN